MKFDVVASLNIIRKPHRHRGWIAVLGRDNWDDYTYKTSFYLSVFSPDGKEHQIGAVKIGHVDLKSGTPIGEHPLPKSFENLDNNFFSLGQGDEYYSNLKTLGDSLREEVLIGLKDVAFDLNLLQRIESLKVFTTSLLRSVNINSVRTQLHRIAQGGELHEAFTFAYKYPADSLVELEFVVRPNSTPPTNVHVLIGRNAVGKTTVLTRIEALVRNHQANAKENESFGFVNSQDGTDSFWNLAAVAFSAFDRFGEQKADASLWQGPTYNYFGLKRPPSEANGDANEAQVPNIEGDIAEESTAGGGGYAHKSTDEIVREFKTIMTSIAGLRNPRRLQFAEALRVLSSDPLIAASPIVEAFCSDPGTESIDVDAIVDEFEEMSSGHKIVLLTIAGLVSCVDEKTLILIDEPETHLHPPLLSAFVRSISRLLVSRNGVAVVATHSPVVLQEVPKNCVWKLSRFGDAVKAERPAIETFGENVGTLTREVFGLEVTKSGFYQMLSDLVGNNNTYEQVMEKLDGQLGSEGRAIVRVMLSGE